MSQSNPKYDLDYSGDRARRGGTPHTGANLSAGQPHDPTEEIRNMINDLQAIAREARSQKESAERERDAVVSRLKDAEAQLAELREKEIEFRKQFVEISALLRDRDTAMENAARAEKRAAELDERLRVANSERTDAQRHRDDAVMRAGEVARQSHDNASQLAEAQRQVVSIRQARDAAQNQNLELHTRIRQLEDELSESNDIRDVVEQSAVKSGEALAEVRAKLEKAEPELESAKARVSTLEQQLESSKKEGGELSAELEGMLAKVTELDAVRTQLGEVSAELESAKAGAQEKAAETEKLRTDVEGLRTELEESRRAAGELETLQRQLAEFATERDAQTARQTELEAEAEAQQSRLVTLTEQLATAQRGREEALTSLNAAQKQIDHIIRDRDQVRQQGLDNSLELEKKIEEMRGQVAHAEQSTVAVTAAQQTVADAERKMLALERERDSFREKAELAERQRLMAVELTAQLDTARRELIRLTAELGEARLQSRQATAALRSQRDDSGEPLTHEINLETTSGETPSGSRMLPPPLPDPEALTQALTEKDAKSTLGAIRRCYQAFVRDSNDLSLLNELHCHLHYFAERARISGCLALYRLGGASAHFVQSIYRNPDQITSSALRTINQTIEFLGILLKQPDYSAIMDPSRAVVYVVDDDMGNCESIKLGLESVGLRAQTSQDPAVALSEIASSRYDLIFLDVNMPRMDGFDLCQNIRQLAMHAKTPIVFLTGMASVENRVQSSISGANDFVPKPFNLNELSVKALTLILKAAISQ